VAELNVGDKAPAFHLVADDGREVALKDYHGRNLVFYFFPKALTPG
jgi:thioredoxin-dependent peroxiredoxin